jgi:tetratricopeptide (TPR) repeat protein
MDRMNFIQKANQLKRKGNLHEAIVEYNRGTKLNPNFAWYHYGLGDILTLQGKFDEAAKAYQTALALKPKSACFYNNLAEVLAKQGKTEEAIASLTKAIEIQPDCDVFQSKLASYSQAQQQKQNFVETELSKTQLDENKDASAHPIELLLLDRHQALSDRQSVIVFTLHKCASVFIAEIFRKLSQESNITYIDLEGFYWLKGEKVPLNSIQKIFQPYGYCYGPCRYFYNVPNLEKYKIVVHLRDPRDILTSMYFSWAYSHALPSSESQKRWFLEFQKKISETGIDDFVISSTKELKNRFNAYFQHFLNQPNVLWVKYEDMVYDFRSWVEKVADFCAFEINQDVLNQLIENSDFSVSQENVYAHKRQVLPGDHQRKLNVNTINHLNKEFEQALEILNYR